jgi:translation initiation factor IF-1
MLGEGERIAGKLDQSRIEIKRGDMVVGYFEITRQHPPP